MNLLALAKSYFSDDVVSQISTMLSENQQNTQTAINGALPTVLNRLIQKSTEPGGAGVIMDMVGQVTAPNRAAGEVITPDGGTFSQLGDMFEGSGTRMNRFMAMGSDLITTLFGDKADTAANALAAHSGIKQTSASSLMSLAGPVLLGTLGKQITTDGTGTSGLSGLLNSQTGNVQTAIPAGLRSSSGTVSGMAVPTSPGPQLTDTESEPGNTASRPASSPVTTPPVTGIPAFSNDHTSGVGSGNRWLPWLLAALGVAALIYFLSR